ncbi:MAG TPA: DUF2973 domain-containing protein [Cyanobacteria bacterium UBA8803]|nr:DUF2973 domain-containing protein [Cyanobacteria bacterium UBA9273]HBL60040.1 DUF2973 domain-containing protein [Cyanobacteria bacterium UBA8803]
MLHLLYVVAFTVIAFLAIGNLIRSLISLGIDSQRAYSPIRSSPFTTSRSQYQPVPHPELLDDSGKPINEPLLVMRSMTVEDAREKLDALYNSSPSHSADKQEEL